MRKRSIPDCVSYAYAPGEANVMVWRGGQVVKVSSGPCESLAKCVQGAMRVARREGLDLSGSERVIAALRAA